MKIVLICSERDADAAGQVVARFRRLFGADSSSGIADVRVSAFREFRIEVLPLVVPEPAMRAALARPDAIADAAAIARLKASGSSGSGGDDAGEEDTRLRHDLNAFLVDSEDCGLLRLGAAFVFLVSAPGAAAAGGDDHKVNTTADTSDDGSGAGGSAALHDLPAELRRVHLLADAMIRVKAHNRFVCTLWQLCAQADPPPLPAAWHAHAVALAQHFAMPDFRRIALGATDIRATAPNAAPSAALPSEAAAAGKEPMAVRAAFEELHHRMSVHRRVTRAVTRRRNELVGPKGGRGAGHGGDERRVIWQTVLILVLLCGALYSLKWMAGGALANGRGGADPARVQRGGVLGSFFGGGTPDQPVPSPNHLNDPNAPSSPPRAASAAAAASAARRHRTRQPKSKT